MPLHLQAGKKQTEVALQLFDQDSNADARGRYKGTGLNYATLNLRDKLVSIFLSWSVIDALGTDNQRTALDLAVIYGHIEAVNQLVDKSIGKRRSGDERIISVLSNAAFRGQAEVAETFPDKSVVVDNVAMLGVAKPNQEESMDILLKHGAGGDSGDVSGRTA
ncbi:hypothetical protein AOQ84DRAFT_379789 [Glonium stellatum]|uniref:Uncharacterized protein n=1 Tax=Glonium stellatum TaxID=574774 RepID=A0A8E2EUR6_9PEZI|nr:hypothetical protein AOQ84DRAFT_379789 [Glonium stellatum]